MKQRLILIIAVAMAVVFTAFLTKQYLTKQYIATKENEYDKLKADLQKKYAKTEAVIFLRDMPRDSLIKWDDIGMLVVLAASLRPEFVRPEDAMHLVGKRTINSLSMRKPVFWSDIENGVAPEP